MAGSALSKSHDFGGVALRKMKAIEYKKEAKRGKKALNLNKSLGIPNRVLHHGWNTAMLVFSVYLVCLYYIEVWGPYHIREGLLGLPAFVFLEIPMGCLYLYSFCAGGEYAFVVEWIAKGSFVHLAVVSCC